MKTYKLLINEIKDRRVDALNITEETKELTESWRTIGAVALVMRIKSLATKIQNVKFSSTDSTEEQIEKMFTKIDLHSQQTSNLSYLVAQINLSK
jgi:hypothetical protein